LRLKNGIGSWTACQALREPEDADRVLGTLHRYGLGVFRIEVGWGSTEYRADLTQPMRLSERPDAMYRAVLQAAKRHGFRLIVLLNAHQGAPCASRYTNAKVLSPVRAGDTQALIHIDEPSMVKLGYTGISGLTHYCAAEGLFRQMTPEPAAGANAYRVTLTKAFDKDCPEGENLGVATLQYRPFGDPAAQESTYAGWGEYADLLARIAQEEGLADGDLDFELWNELTFGTSFLSIQNYDSSIKGEADFDRMLAVAAAAIRRHFPVKSAVINGFSNTTFFFGGFWGSKRPPGVDAESYHPYGHQWRSFPQHALESKAQHVREVYRNADGFLPQYGTLFPEYKGNYIDSHDLITLMQPEMREELVREGHAPAAWKRYMTENALFIPEANAPEPYATRLREQPERYVSKFFLRLYPFYINKGFSAICDGSLRNPGDWKDSWEAKYVETGDETWLKALLPLQRMVGLLNGAQDVPPERLVQLRPRVFRLGEQTPVVFGTEGAVRLSIIAKDFAGQRWDPNRVVPTALTYDDLLCLLPFQIDDSTLAIAAYIQTRNFLEDVPDAGRYELAFPGLQADADAVRVHDPLEDREVPADVTRRGGTLSLTLTLTDCPVWIILRNVDGPRGGGAVTATAG
jgi:hypothetical protein